MSIHPRGIATFVALALLAVAVVACSSPTRANDQAVLAATASAPIVIPTWPVAGNSLRAMMPGDAPEEVRNLLPVTDCGAEMVIDPNSGKPAPDWIPTTGEANRQATDCFISAWGNDKPAQLAKWTLTREGDLMWILYRASDTGSIQVYVRDFSSDEQELNWYTTTCSQITLDQGQIFPAGCRDQRQLGGDKDG